MKFIFGSCAALLATALFSQATPPVSADSKIDVQVQFEGKDRRPVDFEFVHGLIMFRATVAGQSSWVVLDNGAGSSLLDANFAKAQNLQFAGPLPPLQTATGTVERQRVNGVSVEIPHQLKFTSPFSATDLALPSKSLGRPVTMVMGRPFTSNMGFLIYSSRRQFILGPSGKLRIPPGTKYAPLLNELPQVNIEVDGQALVATVDLGSDSAVKVSQSVWARLGLDRARQTKGTSVRLDGKTTNVLRAVAGRVKIGPFEAAQVPVAQGPLHPKDGEAVVGMGFLSRFDFFLDEKDRKLWLVSN